jgi:hypothetical protein
MTKPKFDRNIPFNDLPLLPPPAGINDDSDILRKLVSASRAYFSKYQCDETSKSLYACKYDSFAKPKHRQK